MTYFFVLGNNPTLSIAEIINVLQGLKKHEIKQISAQVLVIETVKKIDCQSLQQQLGGTIKIGQIIGVEKIDTLDNKKQSLVEQIITLLPRNNSKIYPVKCRSAAISSETKLFNRVNFGFSIYGKEHKKVDIKQLAMAVKKKLKQQGISSRWVVSKESVLSSVIVQKNKLLTQGAEFVLVVKDDAAWFGKTITCQEFEEYSFYDYSRPYREIEKGMMPPKLAKMMINLVFLTNKSVLLDPFCGSGTVLQQAILMGYKNIIGADRDKTAVSNTKKNLDWLAGKLNKSFKQARVFQSDVAKMSKKIAANSIDTIITEPYLGPLRFNASDLKSIIKELSQLYIDFFKEFKKVLKFNGQVVIIFPVFRINNKLNFLPILDDLNKIGWQIKSPLPQYILDNPVIKITGRQSIIYSRPNQKILREIFIFTF